MWLYMLTIDMNNIMVADIERGYFRFGIRKGLPVSNYQ